MHGGDEHPKRQIGTATRRTGAWPWRPLVGVLVALAVLCHGSLVVNAAAAGSSAEPSLATVAQDGSPTHAVDCTVNNESLTPSKSRGGNAWASQPPGQAAWLLVADGLPGQAQAEIVTSAPAVRRALLQVFLI